MRDDQQKADPKDEYRKPGGLEMEDSFCAAISQSCAASSTQDRSMLQL